ncbi:secoisolariciresinol dehydrogenase-like [Rhodamnia argentea]|uniref:Secoisolariciresinol dehydrogenase-like n=1 Tax=Rhodamnia argentea TaxID=178133 RepID=A0ABM3HQJ1_9MYRT|nr:secoisolariciresinol dehydrogenase-like [Rhodamnia argentea]
MICRLEGKVAVVTGGACGIGESTARLFSKHGAKVIIADIRSDLGKSVCKDLGPETASFVHCDVSCESDVENAIAAAVDRHGKLDIMVNNAAIGDPPKLNILDIDKADFDKVISVNLTGVFLGAKHAARAMIPLRRGTIINIGSVSSSVGGVASHAYASSKHAVVGLTRNVAAELGPYGIRVNCLSPYFIRTPLSEEMFKIDENPGFRAYSNLEGVTLREEDVAEAALFLGSDESKYISGHNLAVDGGFTTINPAFGMFARA